MLVCVPPVISVTRSPWQSGARPVHSVKLSAGECVTTGLYSIVYRGVNQVFTLVGEGPYLGPLLVEIVTLV